MNNLDKYITKDVLKYIIIGGVLLFVFMFFFFGAYKPNIKKQTKEIKQMEKIIRDLEKDNKILNEKLNTVDVNINKMKGQIYVMEGDIKKRDKIIEDLKNKKDEVFSNTFRLNADDTAIKFDEYIQRHN